MRNRRMSRPLVGVVGIVLVLGLVFWAYNLGKGSAANAQRDAAERLRTTPVSDPAVVDPARLASGTASDAGAATTKPAGAKVAETTAVAAGTTILETPTTPATRPASPAAPAMLAALEKRAVGAALPATRPASDGRAAGGRGEGASGSDATTRAALASANLSPTGALAEARVKVKENKLFDAHRALQSAIASGGLSAEDTAAAKQLLNQVNAILVFSPQRLPEGSDLGSTFKVPPGGVLAKIAGRFEVTPELLMRINEIRDARKLREGQNIKVLHGPFHAVVSKSQFTLELWRGEPGAKSSVYITSFPVGLGADDSTPTGVWAVANKLPNPTYFSPRGEGVIAADDPKNPLGEYWIGLIGTDGQAVGKESYGIHGTIEPDSIGKQASMGCIRLKNEDVASVYQMLLEGKSTVTVKE